MYHPDNILELNISGFDKSAYVKDIINQKNSKKLEIISIFKKSRDSYQEFKNSTDNLRTKTDENHIIEYLESDELEIFFKAFSMKDKFDKKEIQKYQLKHTELSNTKWFRGKISNLLT